MHDLDRKLINHRNACKYLFFSLGKSKFIPHMHCGLADWFISAVEIQQSAERDLFVSQIVVMLSNRIRSGYTL